MLRIRHTARPARAGGLAAAAAHLPPQVSGATGPAATIVRDFADPYLELVRLLREASEIEHALLVQYLYGAYSLKPQYAGIRGFGFANPHDLIGVAIQEMQHLEAVNRMLGALGAAPNLVRQDFPYEPDIYPFPLNLEPLSRDIVVLALPLAPVCREDCAGLCAECGQRLDDLPADHAHEVVDARWAGLAARFGTPTSSPGAPGESPTTEEN